MANLIRIVCPSCFEEFEVAAPPADEVPCAVDYDCEVCCRPMVIRFSECDGDVTAEACSLAD